MHGLLHVYAACLQHLQCSVLTLLGVQGLGVRVLQSADMLTLAQTSSIQAVKPNPTILDYACTKVWSVSHGLPVCL